MSQTYIAIFVTLVAPWLPKLGLEIGNEQLTVTVVTVVSILSALWGLIRRYQAGGINAFGARK